MEPDLEFDLPSVGELVSIAALVGRDRSADEAAKYALTLWKACKAVREAEERQWWDRMSKESNSPKVPLPKSFPASLDAFLLTFVGGRDPSRRLQVLEEYLQSLPDGPACFAAIRTAADEANKGTNSVKPLLPKRDASEIAKEIEGFRKSGFSELEWIRKGEALAEWLKEKSERARSEKARTAAKARHGE